MKIAIIGATGLVGRVMLEVLKERKFPLTELIPIASEKSVGKKIIFNSSEYEVCNIEDGLKKRPNIALFSAGSEISRKFAEKFAEKGTYVVDNSSAWRQDKSKKLIIPEINGNALTDRDLIIANPNCSTIQMLMVLHPLHKKYGIKRIIVSTYQSVSGSGVGGIRQLEDEAKNIQGRKQYPYPIYKNCIPQCDDFLENGYTKEEMKLVNETHKIFNDYRIKISATAVRVPVSAGHSEAVNVELDENFDTKEIIKLLQETKGIKTFAQANKYPMPIDCKNKDDVFVGRIRQDLSNEKALNMWIVADNLRKGAATNTVQIAELLIKNF